MGKSFGPEQIGENASKENVRQGRNRLRVVDNETSAEDARQRQEAAEKLAKSMESKLGFNSDYPEEYDKEIRLRDKDEIEAVHNNQAKELKTLETAESIAGKLVGAAFNIHPELLEDISNKDLGSVQALTNQYMDSIRKQAHKVSEKFGERYEKLVLEKLGDGSRDLASAKSINTKMKNLWDQLENEEKMLADLNESTDNVIKEINSAMRVAGGATETKYATLLTDALKGGRSTDIEIAKEKYNKLQNLYRELQAEVEAAKVEKKINYRKLYKENPDLKTAHDETNAFIIKINRLLAEVKNEKLENDYRLQIRKILENVGTNDLNVYLAAVENREQMGILCEKLEEELKKSNKQV